MSDDKLEKAQTQAQDIRKMYLDQKRADTMSILVMGLFGTGKTRLCASGRLPLLIDSFDPKGTIVLEQVYKEEIASGMILIRTFWNESSKKPTEYKRWETQFENDVRTGFLDRFGTYAIDSASTFIDALSNKVSVIKGREDGTLAIQDYKIIYNTIKDIIKVASSQDCDFILTAHLVDEVDEVTGKVVSQLSVYRGLKAAIPILFTEKYVLMNKPGAGGVERQLLTQDYKTFKASTQVGANCFGQIEEPNLSKLREKAGFPTEHKSSLLID
jgi:hypothetical protein